MSLDESLTGDERMDKVVETVQGESCRDLFDILCTQWEQAA